MNNTTQKNEQQELPPLPQSLLIAIGEYGLARTDGVGELEVQHRWETLIRGIKQYAAALSRPYAIRAQAMGDCADSSSLLHRAEDIARCYDLGTPDGHAIADAIRSLASQPVQDGYVLVPVEPTDAMLQAAWDSCSFGDETTYRECWKAMLAAAPQPSPEAQPVAGHRCSNPCFYTACPPCPEASSDKAVVSDEQIEKLFYKELECDGGWALYEVTPGNIIRFARALLQSAAPAMPANDSVIRIDLSEEEAKDLREYIGEGENERPITLAVMSGALYALDTEYLDEAATFIAEVVEQAAPAQAVAKDISNRRFERWAIQERELPERYLERNADGEYKYPTVQCDWTTWQAALASLSVSAQEGKKK